MRTGRGQRAVIGLLVAVQVVLLVFFAFTRLVDGDEGFYLSAAREVSQGKTLYVDFFYPQMPYLPYVFSFFAGHGMTTLFATRLASTGAAVLTTLIFLLILLRLTSDRRVVAVLLAMYVFSGLVISWHSVAKTFAWTDLFLMAGFYFLWWGGERRRWTAAALSGACMALAASTRLVLAPLVILFALPIMLDSPRDRVKRLLVYFVSAVAVSLPAVMLMFQDFRRFAFDNLGFHFMRNPLAVFPETFYQRLLVIGKLLINPQVLILVLLAVATLVYRRRRRTDLRLKTVVTSPSGLAGIAALVITVIYLLPTPVHQQYFVQAVPFAILAIPAGVGAILERRKHAAGLRVNRRLAGVLLGIYILGLVPYIVIYVGAVRDSDGYTNIGNMKRISEHLNREDYNDPVLAELPVITVLSDREGCPGMEFLGFEYPLRLNDEEKRYYRLILNSDVRAMLEARTPAYYVVVNDPPEETAVATAANYRLEGTYEKFKVYGRKP